jgi:hypothetical protein
MVAMARVRIVRSQERRRKFKQNHPSSCKVAKRVIEKCSTPPSCKKISANLIMYLWNS